MKFQFKHVLYAALSLSVLRVFLQWQNRVNRDGVAVKSPAVSVQNIGGTLRSVRRRVVLDPPRLSAEALGESVVSYQGVRNMGPRMEFERVDGVAVIHHYGMGNSGCALAPGAAQYVRMLLRNHAVIRQGEPEMSVPITVVGAGISGLFTAYELIQEGYSNVQIIAEHFDDLSSQKAGGMWAPYAAQRDTAKGFLQAELNSISQASYAEYKRIAQGEHPHFSSKCARLLPSYFTDKAHAHLESLVAAGLMRPAEEVAVVLGNKEYDMVEYPDGLFIDVAVLMRELSDYLTMHPNVNIQQKKLAHFRDPSILGSVVIDCAGLGARVLAHDSTVRPVKDHSVMLKNQLRPYQLTMRLHDYIDQHGQLCMQSFYYTPGTGEHHQGILGGSHCTVAGESVTNDDNFANVVDNAKRIMGL